MGRSLVCCIVLAIGLPALAEAPEADESTQLSYTLEPATVSSYVWRGDRFSSDDFEPALQPYVELEASKLGPGDLVAGVWTSRMLGPDPGQEIDPYLNYTVELGWLALKPGYALYMLPSAETVDAMHEFSLQSSLVWAFPITPYVAVALDPIRSKGFYASAGATHELQLAPATLVTTLNFGASHYNELSSSLQDITLSSRGQLPFGSSGYYGALVAASAWSGRAQRLYPYTGLSLGFSH